MRLVLFVLAMGFLHDSSHPLSSAPSLAGHWMLDSSLTAQRRTDAGRNPAEPGAGSPLGKELYITQAEDKATVTYSLAGQRITMVYRFDGKETRNTTIGRDAPIEERSVAQWEGNTLVVRTTRTQVNSAVAFPKFVRRWSLQGDVLNVATETSRGMVDTIFRRVAGN
jgi:hypothetical protein